MSRWGRNSHNKNILSDVGYLLGFRRFVHKLIQKLIPQPQNTIHQEYFSLSAYLIFSVANVVLSSKICDKKGMRTNLQFNKKVVWNFLLKYEASFAGTRNFFHWNEIKEQVVVARTQKGEEKASHFCQKLHRLHFFRGNELTKGLRDKCKY